MNQEVKVPKHATISAVVHRADGTVEDLGVIAEAEVVEGEEAKKQWKLFRKDKK